MTTADWDFSTSAWQLQTGDYVTSPSCLEMTSLIEVKVKTSVVPIDKVKQGQLITYFRRIGGMWKVYFRYQDANNFYAVWYDESVTKWKVQRVYGGVSTTLKETTVSGYPSGGWDKIKVTWYDDPAGLVIRVEKWTGTAWEKLWSDVIDTPNYWKTVGGRVGFYAFPSAAAPWRIDDTEIWGL